MDFNLMQTFLAQAAPGTVEDPRAKMASTALMIGVMVVMFYFVLIRPQQKKTKEHTALLKNVKAGDRILTSSGIVATVVTVKEKTLTIRSADTKLEITKSAIAEITGRSGEASES